MLPTIASPTALKRAPSFFGAMTLLEKRDVFRSSLFRHRGCVNALAHSDHAASAHSD
jgi:hypothetical protein